jgi:hypothetical protein
LQRRKLHLHGSTMALGHRPSIIRRQSAQMGKAGGSIDGYENGGRSGADE